MHTQCSGALAGLLHCLCLQRVQNAISMFVAVVCVRHGVVLTLATQHCFCHCTTLPDHATQERGADACTDVQEQLLRLRDIQLNHSHVMISICLLNPDDLPHQFRVVNLETRELSDTPDKVWCHWNTASSGADLNMLKHSAGDVMWCCLSNHVAVALCCVVLRCAALCCFARAAPCRAAPRHATPRCAVLCCAVLCCAVLCSVIGQTCACQACQAAVLCCFLTFPASDHNTHSSVCPSVLACRHTSARAG